MTLTALNKAPFPCREWQGTRTAKGYGQYRNTLVHRWVWTAIHGPIPPGRVDEEED
jgi:hypothetical protein